jgi:hypothetical protein
MALTVEDGSGLAAAESYLSVADADTYWSKHGNPPAWEGASDSNKEDALRRATQWIDLHYGDRFSGRKRLSTQALRWPRLGATTDEDFAILASTIPESLKDATAEMARRAVGTELLSDRAAADNITEQTEKMGDMQRTFKFSGTKSPEELYPKVGLILAEISIGSGDSTGVIERG